MPKQLTQNPSIASSASNLVEVRKDQPFTTTLAVADGCQMTHESVIKLVRKYKADFEEFGPFRFQIQKSGGRPTEYAELSEDQATYLITLFRNNEVVRGFKIRLVKAFRAALNEIERLTKQQYNPDWLKIRADSICSFKMQNATLKDMRETRGKTTAAKHYMCEAKLIGYVMTGKFSGIDRSLLSAGDLALIADLQRVNAMLIAQDVPYKERKSALMNHATKRLAA